MHGKRNNKVSLLFSHNINYFGGKIVHIGPNKKAVYVYVRYLSTNTSTDTRNKTPSNGKCISVFYSPKTTKTTDEQFQICIFIDVNQTFEMTAIPQEKNFVTPIIHQVDHMMGDSVWICLGVSCMYTYMSLFTKINMLWFAMLCYVMLCYVMLCYVMLCYVMLCYVMLL